MRSAAYIAMSLFLMIAVTGVSVQTHYCNGMARYSTVAVDNEPSSCCGDDMPACPSCEDEVTSNVLSTPLSLVTPTDGSMNLAALPMPMPPVPAATFAAPSVPALVFDMGPPGVTRGSTIPILVSSFLI